MGLAYLRILELCKLLKLLSTVQSVAVSSSFCRPWRFFPWIPRGPPPLLTHNKPKIKSCRRKSMRSFWAIHYISAALKNWLHRGWFHNKAQESAWMGLTRHAQTQTEASFCIFSVSGWKKEEEGKRTSKRRGIKVELLPLLHKKGKQLSVSFGATTKLCALQALLLPLSCLT